MLDTEGVCDDPEGRCDDHAYRLAVYQAGHALVARALGHRIMTVRLLPRPPITITDKSFLHNNWDSFMDMLEARVIELFGGQMAEHMICGSHTCCTGDISRIDELTRLLAGLNEDTDYEDVFFHLEEVAQNIFTDSRTIDALLPLAEFLYEKELATEYEIPGEELDAIIDQYVDPIPQNNSRFSKLFKMISK
ncbi:protein of unknown function [Magnetospira sp. QH-2]|nr:protein of unknown function [Magnetospira sp. QH-2]